MLECLLLSVGAGRHWRLVKTLSHVSRCSEQLSVLAAVSYWRKKCHLFLKKHHTGVTLQLSVLVRVWSLHRFAFVDVLGSLTHPHRQQDQGTQLEDDIVVGLSLSKEVGGCEYLGGQIYRGIKRTESFLLGPPHVLLPWAHCNKSNHAHVVGFHIFPEFSPSFSSLENAGCKGMRAFAAPWYLTCTEMSISTAWRCRGLSVQPAKTDWDPQLDIDAVLSAKLKEPLLCRVDLAALKVEKTTSFLSLHQNALECPMAGPRYTLIWDAH